MEFQLQEQYRSFFVCLREMFTFLWPWLSTHGKRLQACDFIAVAASWILMTRYVGSEPWFCCWGMVRWHCCQKYPTEAWRIHLLVLLSSIISNRSLRSALYVGYLNLSLHDDSKSTAYYAILWRLYLECWNLFRGVPDLPCSLFLEYSYDKLPIAPWFHSNRLRTPTQRSSGLVYSISFFCNLGLLLGHSEEGGKGCASRGSAILRRRVRGREQAAA